MFPLYVERVFNFINYFTIKEVNMKPLNAYLDIAKSKLTKVGTAVMAGGTALIAAAPVRADIVTDVKTAIDGASTQANSVGTAVVVAIAALVVVTLIISMVRKL